MIDMFANNVVQFGQALKMDGKAQLTREPLRIVSNGSVLEIGELASCTQKEILQNIRSQIQNSSGEAFFKVERTPNISKFRKKRNTKA